MRIGFVGAGLMGAHMVRNLAAAGFEVRLYARTPSRAEGLPAEIAGSVREAAEGAEAFCSIVTDSPDVRDVVTEALTADDPPELFIDMSTISPAVAKELAHLATRAGSDYLDAPVSGGPPGAEAGTLAFMVGGEPAAFAHAIPIFDALGDPAKRTHCGPVGTGLVAKLVNNLLVASIAASTAEALGVGQQAGVPAERLREVVMASSGASWQLENLFPRVLAGDHAPGFRARDLRKDLRHARNLADRDLPI
ncbi:MAG: NAD(P)-dependent oxidoreductase, partial [Thermoleophilia bacterium]|nr:NAD(P)-dependent oxidoreductase [Thermoleophilia bacterium]